MSRKHFRSAAESIAKVKDATDKRTLAEAFAVQFSQANPRFDRARFMAACGL